jgi:uncharacterized protein with PhoU and TrkA domain
MVIAVKRDSGEYIYNPTSSLVIEQGDELIVFADGKRMANLRKVAAGLKE